MSTSNMETLDNRIAHFEKDVFVASIRKSKSDTKKYGCSQCSKYFTRPSALQSHIYTHTGEKPHQCDIPGCGRRFAVVSNLRRHLRVHRPNYVRHRLTSHERRGYVEKLIQKSASAIDKDFHYNSNSFLKPSSTNSSQPLWFSPLYDNCYRLLKPKETRPLCLTVKHLLN